MSSGSLINSPAWKALEKHYEKIEFLQMRNLFAQDPKRFDKFSLRFNDILLDFSKNRITDETLPLLRALEQPFRTRGSSRFPSDIHR